MSWPVAGDLVRVRDRPATVLQARPWARGGEIAECGVDLLYLDGERPYSESVLWGVESGHTARQRLSAMPDEPLSGADMAARIRSNLWHAGMPHVSLATGVLGAGSVPLLAPLQSGAEELPYQWVPVLKALSHPRIRLLLADDVGLGKTVEAGLIMAELIARRRIRRVLLLTPPGLRGQWQQELWDKFAIGFHVVDGQALRRWREEMAHGPGPWASLDRLIVSYHLLRRPEILADFLSASSPGGAPRLPWDLLVVDEAHRLMPRTGSGETATTRMLRTIAGLFEHRIFLSATPHDGGTLSLTGLLEILDPLSFRRTSCPTPAERQRMTEQVIRRSRAQLSADGQRGRTIHALPVAFAAREKGLFEAFDRFKRTVVGWGRVGDESRRGVLFGFEVLTKRLLSSHVAFATSFHAFADGIEAAGARTEPRHPPAESLPAVTPGECPDAHWLRLARAVGEWMARHFPATRSKLEEVLQALAQLGLAGPESDVEYGGIDSRAEVFLCWCKEKLSSGSQERALVFTEYRSTLSYLARRLSGALPELASAVACVDGATPSAVREERYRAFCRPDSGLRLLLCTDVAAEGLNLQGAARLVFHYDLPWNPALVDQRIGRLDRYGQQGVVRSFHFTSKEREELAFLDRVQRKAATMRHDLGRLGPLLEAHSRDVLAGGEILPLPEFLDCRPSAGPAVETVCSQLDPGPGVRRTVARARSRQRLEVSDLRTVLAGALRTLPEPGTLLGPRRGDYRVCARGADWLAPRLVWPAHRQSEDSLPPLSFSGSGLVSPGGVDPLQVLHLRHPLVGWATQAVRSATRGSGIPWCIVDGHGSGGGHLLVLLLERAYNRLYEQVHGALVPHLLLPPESCRSARHLVSPSTAWASRVLMGASLRTVSAAPHAATGLQDELSLLAPAIETIRRCRQGVLESALVALGKEQRRSCHAQAREWAVEAGTATRALLERQQRGLLEDADKGFLFAELATENRRQQTLVADELRALSDHERLLSRIRRQEQEDLLTKVLPASTSLAFPLHQEVVGAFWIAGPGIDSGRCYRG